MLFRWLKNIWRNKARIIILVPPSGQGYESQPQQPSWSSPRIHGFQVKYRYCCWSEQVQLIWELTWVKLLQHISEKYIQRIVSWKNYWKFIIIEAYRIGVIDNWTWLYCLIEMDLGQNYLDFIKNLPDCKANFFLFWFQSVLLILTMH